MKINKVMSMITSVLTLRKMRENIFFFLQKLQKKLLPSKNDAILSEFQTVWIPDEAPQFVDPHLYPNMFEKVINSLQN